MPRPGNYEISTWIKLKYNTETCKVVLKKCTMTGVSVSQILDKNEILKCTFFQNEHFDNRVSSRDFGTCCKCR